MSDKETAECGYFVVVDKTSKALQLEGADGMHWVPKSQILDDGVITSESEIDDEGELVLPEWLAVKNGFV